MCGYINATVRTVDKDKFSDLSSMTKSQNFLIEICYPVSDHAGERCFLCRKSTFVLMSQKLLGAWKCVFRILTRRVRAIINIEAVLTERILVARLWIARVCDRILQFETTISTK